MIPMSKKEKTYPIPIFEQLHTPGAGYDVLRYVSLPELLGKESDTILYFMGKNLARLTEIHTVDDIILYFKHFGWGTLEVVKQKKKSMTLHLLDDSIAQRLQSPFDIEFRYESGFLAQAMQKTFGVECECLEEIQSKIYQVEFTIVFTEK